ncbi:hypothetical protein GCM10025868_13640 [Angustibacter aerolatus]|uniref:N-acylglucosamine 2-epimerase n=1 Tax=Angustibacter aerolatus TaxID=1162965 RepID=A0ABQ6JE85_9ACTN|nr:hypothetical protein GCM10025868_13640 [Angustibacter aerolatus]
MLGPDDGAWAAQALGVTASGTFEHGGSTLRRLAEPSARLDDVLARLHEARGDRPQPGRDDKVVAAWNGLAVAALAETGALLDRPDLVEAAERAAGLLLDVHVVDGVLRRVSRDGVVGSPAGTLEDHGDVVEGLLALHACTGAARWLTAAGALVEAVRDRFWHGGAGFSDTPDDDVDERLRTASGGVRRPADPADNAHPSGPSAAAGALVSWFALTGDDSVLEPATWALDAARRVAGGAPRFAGWGLAVAEALLDGPREVAVVGAPGAERDALVRTALRSTAPGLVLGIGEPDAEPVVPLLADRGARDGRPTAYPCRGGVCERRSATRPR